MIATECPLSCRQGRTSQVIDSLLKNGSLRNDSVQRQVRD